jgi:hypothetical protein
MPIPINESAVTSNNQCAFLTVKVFHTAIWGLFCKLHWGVASGRLAGPL